MYFICVFFLVNVGMEEKLICKRLGYRFNVLFEKFIEENVFKILKILYVYVGLSVILVLCFIIEK